MPNIKSLIDALHPVKHLVEQYQFFLTLPYLVTLLCLLASLCHGNAGSNTSVTRRDSVTWYFHHHLVVGSGKASHIY